eukprot:gb/GECH01001943.1/.p1 GENE.gb/GECH01001943.1/~~gb/GECH01001943.1/.p1  ORF type:complete len:442 (+),score=87.12 gb/GECH01001943.1/:1-1326(+)
MVSNNMNRSLFSYTCHILLAINALIVSAAISSHIIATHTSRFHQWRHCPLSVSSHAHISNGNNTWPRNRHQPYILAHRGARAFAPENTVPAFMTAWEQGADVIETDVRRTRDHVLVCFHDSTLTRLVPEQSGVAVRHLTLAELRTVFPMVSTLAEAVHALPDTVPINIEIKDNDIQSAQHLAEYINASGIGHRTLVVSQFCSVIHAFRIESGFNVATAACEGEVVGALILARTYFLPLMTLVYPMMMKMTVMRTAARNTFTEDTTAPSAIQEGYWSACHPIAIQPPVAMGGVPLIDEAAVRALHDAGIAVQVWVVNSEADVRSMTESGVDGIISDRTDVAVSTLHAMGVRRDRDAVFPPQRRSNIPDPTWTSEEGGKKAAIPDIPPESHRCVSAVCEIMKHVYTMFTALLNITPLLGLVYFVVYWFQIFLMQIRTRKEKKD